MVWAKVEASFFLGWNLVRYLVLILQECNKLTRCNGPGSELAPLLSGCVSRSDLTQSFARGPGGTEISRLSASVPTRCHPQPDWEINDEPHETVCQVWPLTHFFLFPFCFPRLRLRPSKGFLSWHGALLGPSTRLVRCFRNYRDTRTPPGVPR